MKRVSILILAAGLLGLAVPASAARVASVNLKKVLENYTGGQAAKESLRQREQEESDKLQKKKEALDKEFSALKAKKSALSEEKFSQALRKLQEKGNDFEKEYRSVMGEMQMLEAKQLNQFLDLVREACAKVAKKEKYDQVFDSATLLYGADEITASVIQAVNGK